MLYGLAIGFLSVLTSYLIKVGAIPIRPGIEVL
jgi:hypothetical protein